METVATISRNTSPAGEMDTTCYHCGESCTASGITLEDKSFCCEGCKMVYEILNANDLCQYYQIEEVPGISLKGRRLEHYAYLDDPEVREKLIDFSDGERTRVHFYLPQIHCASCIWLLENLHRLSDGVRQATVNFPRKQIDLTYQEDATSLRKVVELLASIGYAPAINLSDLEAPRQKAVDRRLYYQLGVAGFAFGNIMLLSFPEYLGLAGGAGHSFQRWFGGLNILLALPVVFYSGWDYLKSAFLGLKHRHLNMDVPISLGILTLFVRSTLEILTLNGAGYLDSLAGLVFFLLIGKWFQQKTFHHLSFERDYRSYFPIAATLREGDNERTVPVNKLEPGQTIIVRHGELVPADGILLKGKARIDYSFVTGEADPIEKTTGEKLYAGGRQTGEQIELTLTKKVSQSYLTRLWNDDAFQKEVQTMTGRLADRVARYFTLIILTLAIGTLAYWLYTDSRLAINAFTAVLIIACPCAVALSVPFTFGNSLRILARNGFFLKNVNVIESIDRIGTVVFDKTGTLTRNRQARVEFAGSPLSPLEEKWIRSLVRQSAHPASRLIDRHLGEGEVMPVGNFREITGSGIEGVVCQRLIRIGSRAFITAHLPQGMPETDEQGVCVQINHEVRGAYRIESSYRSGLAAVIADFRRQFRLFLLSGDNDREREVLQPLFGEAQALRFEQSPADKLEFIRQLQESGEKVMMLGDGLNDAGALKRSDVGIVLSDDTNNFTPASDAILAADRFRSLPQFLLFARRSIRLVYGAYGLALIYNIVGLSFAVQATLSPVIAAILMPASSITIVVFGVLSSNLLAWRMGLDGKNDKNHSAG